MGTQARCKKCGETIHSLSIHDYKTCSCGEIMVDGGFDYARYGAKNWSNFKIIRHEHEKKPYKDPVEDKEKAQEHMHDYKDKLKLWII